MLWSKCSISFVWKDKKSINFKRSIFFSDFSLVLTVLLVQHAWAIISSRSESANCTKTFLFISISTGRGSGTRLFSDALFSGAPPAIFNFRCGSVQAIPAKPWKNSWAPMLHKSVSKISSSFKKKSILLHTKEIQYLDHTILLYGKNFINGRRLTSGGGWTSRIPVHPCV